MKKLFIILLFAFATSVIWAAPETALAANPIESACQGAGGDCGLTGGPTVPSLIRDVSNMLVYIITIIAVIMIIVGAIRYTTSGGDQAAITGAKNTIIYSIVGIIVAWLAFSIVNFVVSNIK